MEQPDSRQGASRIDGSAHDASLPRGDGAQTRGRVISGTRAALTFLQSYLDVILGAVLVLAGVLKGHQLLTDPSAARASGFPRELLAGAAAFELGFGCWMLAGVHRRLMRWLALAWFTNLALVSLGQTSSGAASCACFGALHTRPSLMFTFDVAAVAALWMWSPCGYVSRWRLPAALCLSLFPAALFGLEAAPRDQTIFAEIDLGEIAQGGRMHHAFQFRNDSGVFVEVAAFETSCPCASVRLERTGIPVGRFLVGEVALDMGREPDFVGNLAIEVKGLTQHSRIGFILTVSAHVYPSAKAE